jgi:uncharacterized phage protein (TIGR01671 family)
MRVIKFRFWNKESKIMGIGHDLLHIGHSFIEVYENPDIFELMQFTGLLDKAGKEIYEGDILEAVKREQCGKNPDFTRTIRDVVNKHLGGFKVFSKNMQDFSTKDDNRSIKWMMYRQSTCLLSEDDYYEIVDVEIIGNIYENPELLEAK